MKNLTPEFIEKANAAKNAEELFELAKANNVGMTEEEAKIYFEQMSENATVSDEELASVAGGYGDSNTIMAGNRVRAIDGTVCSHCGCAVGVVAVGPGVPSIKYVKCMKCGNVMSRFFNNNKFRKL